jgi:predicted nuclease of predicted toxin-antitoxin system
VKFKIDENLPLELVNLLNSVGHDVASVLDQKLGGAIDSTLAEHCRAEGRALLTLDLGFADIRRYPPERFPRLVVLRVRRHDTPYLLDVVRQLLPRLSTEPLPSHLWIVEEGRLRVRG